MKRGAFLTSALATAAGLPAVRARASGAISGPLCLRVKDEGRHGIIAFELPVLGSTTTMRSVDLPGKALWLNFFASWCGDCNEEMPDLLALEAKYRDRGLTVIGIDVGESTTLANGFRAHFNIPFPILLDTDSAVFDTRVGTGHFPTHMFYNEQRYLTCIGIEGFRSKDMENEIAVALGS